MHDQHRTVPAHKVEPFQRGKRLRCDDHVVVLRDINRWDGEKQIWVGYAREGSSGIVEALFRRDQPREQWVTRDSAPVPDSVPMGRRNWYAQVKMDDGTGTKTFRLSGIAVQTDA